MRQLCTHCKIEKDILEFSKGGNANGLANWCKGCCKNYKEQYYIKNKEKLLEKSKNWERDNPEKRAKISKRYKEKVRSRDCIKRNLDRKMFPDKDKNQRLKNKYSITLDEFNNKVEKQNHVCAICKTHMSKPCVDHDHKCCSQNKRSCGKCIRGILCDACNRLLGDAKDSIECLQNAIKY